MSRSPVGLPGHGGTIEYGEIIQRRARRRRLVEADQRAAQEAGLRGMVRVLLVER